MKKYITINVVLGFLLGIMISDLKEFIFTIIGLILIGIIFSCINASRYGSGMKLSNLWIPLFSLIVSSIFSFLIL